MGKLVRFERKHGKYLTSENEEITIEMLMNHEHYIHDDEGLIHLDDDCNTPKKIEDIGGELLADLRNKLSPVKNALALAEHDGSAQHMVLREIQHAKEVIKYVCQQP